MTTKKEANETKITTMDVVRYNERRECIKEFKKLVKDAIEEAERINGCYDEWAEADAFHTIRDAVENM